MNSIYFSDIDGTLLNAEREPSAMLKTEVDKLTDNGHPFILISSRMPQAMTWIQNELGITGSPLIAYNGGLVLADGETLHSEEILIHVVRAARELLVGTKLSIQLFHGSEWYVERMDFYAKREENNTRVSPTVRNLNATIKDWEQREISAHKIMLMGEKEELDEVAGVLGRVFHEVIHLYRSKDTYLEIASKQISKLTGIGVLLAARYPNLTLADCIAFGDNYNDIEMLAGVGTGIAVGNARPEVIAVADAVTAGNKEDGVAKWLAGNAVD